VYGCFGVLAILGWVAIRGAPGPQPSLGGRAMGGLKSGGVRGRDDEPRPARPQLRGRKSWEGEEISPTGSEARPWTPRWGTRDTGVAACQEGEAYAFDYSSGTDEPLDERRGRSVSSRFDHGFSGEGVPWGRTV